MTKLEKILELGKYNADELITFGCPMDFGMRGDTSLCPTGCKTCWNEECEESQKSIDLLEELYENICYKCRSIKVKGVY